LKYYQVVAQVAHRVVTMITALAEQAVVTAQKHYKNQCMDLQTVQHIQCVLLAHQNVAAAVHVT
jgi:hypothetical protein